MTNDASASDGLAIHARGLSKRFGEVVAVDHLDLDVRKGTVHGFLGPNGSGKSTTIRMLCGLLAPSTGSAQVLGMDIPRQAEQLRPLIGYMTQKFSLFDDLTVRENLHFMAELQLVSNAPARIEAMLETYNLRDLSDRLAGRMSGGQRQRLALACAVIHEPQLLLLDEPTSAVDPQSRREFWEQLFRLADRGTTLLVSTHYMDEAERCHQLSILAEGRLVADGTPVAMMDALHGQTLLVHANDLRQAQALLSTLPTVQGIAQIGMGLRVLLTPSAKGAGAEIAAALNAKGLAATVEPVAANLEDVFVNATRQTAVSA